MTSGKTPCERIADFSALFNALYNVAEAARGYVDRVVAEGREAAAGADFPALAEAVARLDKAWEVLDPDGSMRRSAAGEKGCRGA
jgi:hypothetical protein